MKTKKQTLCVVDIESKSACPIERGPVSVEIRAQHFCDGCMNLLDDSTAKA